MEHKFNTDTTRTINSLLFNETVVRYPDIRLIFAHGGGTIGAVTGRMGAAARKLPEGLMYELRKSYYDTGQAVNVPLLASYKALAPVSHILFGADFPLGPGIAATARGLRENGGFTDAELCAIERENALEQVAGTAARTPQQIARSVPTRVPRRFHRGVAFSPQCVIPRVALTHVCDVPTLVRGG
jgi:predicted TIM-barrel fold metal-dependent hydrolase